MDELITNKTSSMSITNSEEKQGKAGKTRKTSKKTDGCQELKNIAYRTMLLNGNDINPKHDTGKSASSITTFLEEELSANKKESWTKLDKTQKIQRLNIFALEFVDKYQLTDQETESLKKYFIKCLERKMLLKSKEVIYDKDKSLITNIPCLFFNEPTRSFILKRDDKHISTAKSLPKPKSKTIKHS